MRTVKTSSRFRKEYKLMTKRGKDIAKLDAVITLLANDEPLPPANCDHPLKGNLAGFRDCHIEPDWVLIYKKIDDEILELRELFLDRTGTHSDLL